MMDENKLRLIVKEECSKANSSMFFIYLMLFIIMLSSCDTNDKIYKVKRSLTNVEQKSNES